MNSRFNSRPHTRATAGKPDFSGAYDETSVDDASSDVALPLIEKMPVEDSAQTKDATAQLLESFKAPRSRRSLVKGVVTAGVGMTVAGVGALYAPAFIHAKSSSTLTAKHVQAQSSHAQSLSTLRSTHTNTDTIVSILTVARTAERLAVTFYTNGVANAGKLGISGEDLNYLKAALIEEQIHELYLAANGGQVLTSTFSFPQGASTFTDLNTFIATQQQLEGVFDSAYLAAVMEFAQLGRPDLAQVAAQVACIEAEHRALGRSIGGLSPADNWAFTPVLVASVGDAPGVVQQAGYLSPVAGNSYTYQEVSSSGQGVEQVKPYSMSTGTVVGNG